ncbi:MAG: glycogen synthase [Actinomycetota bacterium]|jgi:glycosyltransferase involved in cell wall biosynthesis
MRAEVTRILVLSNLYPPHAIGGYEHTCRDVVRRLRARGHVVDVLTSSWRSPDAEDEGSDAGVRRELLLTSTFVPPRPRFQRWSVERSNLRRLRERLAAFRPDVVSIWNMAGLSLALLVPLVRSRLPLIYVISDDWPVDCVARDPWMSAFQSRRGLGRAVTRWTGVPTSLPDIDGSGVFVFNSEFLRDDVRARSAWSFTDSTVARPGIDRDDFPLVDPEVRHPFVGRLLYVGRLDRTKGIETLVRALALLPPLMTLDIVGHGATEYTTSLDHLVAELGLTDRARRRVEPRRRLAQLYRAADVCVFPSEWDEPFGLVPLEAMACGTPVVATGTGGSAEYLRDGYNCLLFPAGDPEALAARVLALSGDEPLRRRLGRNGVETASALTIDTLADRLEVLHTQT